MAKYTKQQWVTERIKYFWEVKRNFETAKVSFEDEKYEFYEQMDRYYDEVADDEGKFYIDVRDTVRGVKKIICQKISTISIEFDVEKIKKLLNKEQKRTIIRKKYAVNNWPALLKLLKDSGVDWNEFKKYVNITESVDDKQLEKLIDLGELDIDKVKKCSEAKVKSQYYKITEK